MDRVKVVGIGASSLVLVAAVTWSALPLRSASDDAPALKPYILVPPGAPETSGVAHEPAGVIPPLHDSGRATPSAPGRTGDLSDRPAMLTSTKPSSNGGGAAPAKTRWTVIDVPAAEVQRLSQPGTRRNDGPIAARPSPHVNREHAPVVDTDADWYAAPADGASPLAKRPTPAHGRVAKKALPVRDAGDASWYDSLGANDESSEASSLSSFEDSLLAGIDPAAVFSGETRKASRAAGSPVAASGARKSRGGRGVVPELRGLSKHGDGVIAATPAAPETRWRLVKLAPPAGEEIASRSSSRPSPSSPVLPPPHEDTHGEPTVVLASLGPKLSGTGAQEFPGLAEPLPEPTQKPTSFCPIGLVEKKTKGERFCARADKTGITFREGPVSFLYPNGKKKAQGTYVNGKLEGAYVEFATNGKKTAEGVLSKGTKNGEWTFWWDDGKKQSRGKFVNGERTGVWVYWDEKGRRLYEGEIRTVGNVEKKQGKWVFFHPNGNKKQEGTFAGGKKDGAWKTYDEKGRQVSVLVFKDGEEEIR